MAVLGAWGDRPGNGQPYVVTRSQSENGVSGSADTETIPASTGSLVADEGLGVMVRTDMASAQVGDRHFIILGSFAASGKSGASNVVELRESGALMGCQGKDVLRGQG